MTRQVKGILFADYVRMIRACKAVDWPAHLDENDLSYLSRAIDPAAWYPIDVYEHLGLAILKEIANRNLLLVRIWGRKTVDELREEHAELLTPGDPRTTLMHFQVLRQALFDFPAARVTLLGDRSARMEIDYGMSPEAEEAAVHQSIGFLERLLEVSGAKRVEVETTRLSWKDGPPTSLALRWSL